MTREEAKHLLPIIQAYADGKNIQYLNKDYIWEEFDDNTFSGSGSYRIKPEPKYRPFKTTEECWNEMLKHQPFGWIRNKITNSLYNITTIYKNNDIVTITTEYSVLTSSELLENFVFIDGISLGIKEE